MQEKVMSFEEVKVEKVNYSLAFSIFSVGVLFYCFAYLLRVYPSVMQADLLKFYGITASSFGVLTSFYYFGYAPMQIPVGLAIDKIGIRRSLITACLIAVLGCYIFAHSQHFEVALLGRWLIGAGCSFAYVTSLKIATVWLPRKYFATAAGIVTGCGMSAAILTDIYLTHLMRTYDFQQTLNIMIYLGVLVLCLIVLFIKDKKKSSQATVSAQHRALDDSSNLKHALLSIVKNPQIWLIGAVGCFLYLPSSVFLDTWAIPYLTQAKHLSATNAAYGVSLMFIGWITSTLIVGAVSDMLGNRRLPLFLSAISATLISLVLFYSPDLSRLSIYCLLFLLGVCCGPHPLCFTLSKENLPKNFSGTAIASSNFLIMMGGFLFQPLVGRLLDWSWQGKVLDGIRIYSAYEYNIALSIIPITLVLSIILTYFIKDTYKK